MRQKSIKRLVAVYDDSVPNYCTVTRWFNKFKRGCQSLEDDPRSGRPSKFVVLFYMEVAKLFERPSYVTNDLTSKVYTL